MHNLLDIRQNRKLFSSNSTHIDSVLVSKLLHVGNMIYHEKVGNTKIIIFFEYDDYLNE